MKLIKYAIILLLIGALSGCAATQNITREYSSETDPDKAVIFGVLELDPPNSFFFNAWLYIKNAETKKTYGILSKGKEFFAIKVKPGKYYVDSVIIIGGQTISPPFAFEVTGENTAVNIGTIVVKETFTQYGPTARIKNHTLLTKDNFEETEWHFHAEYPNLNPKITRKSFSKAGGFKGFVEQLLNVKELLTASPDNRHWAHVSRKENKGAVVRDGKEEKQYGDIVKDSLVFSPDSQHLAYVAREDVSTVNIVLSTQGERPAYRVEPRGKMFVVLDGNEQKLYAQILPPVFSPDSKRLAYVAGEDNKIFAVIDGKEETHYDSLGKLVFSPDSKNLVYGAKKDGKFFMVLGGKEGKQYALVGRPVFSPDGKHLAYGADEGNKTLVVLDGNEQKQYDDLLGELVFSPDSKHLVYVVKSGDKRLAILDGNEQKQYDSVGELVFSPDGKHLAYRVKEGDKMFVVLDGDEQKQYDIVGKPVFSPDSKHLAYGVKKDGKKFVILDVNEQKQYDEIFENIEFSPDSKRLAYVAKSGSKEFVVLDGNDQKKYSSIGSLIFSPDSKHLCYKAVDSERKKIFIVIDGEEEKQHVFVLSKLAVSPIVFDSPINYHYLLDSGDSIQLVEETIKEQVETEATR